jgi:GntR family transcriptional regulator, transcriptional repressor for pyruvate dehydrogenase complex
VNDDASGGHTAVRVVKPARKRAAAATRWLDDVLAASEPPAEPGRLDRLDLRTASEQIADRLATAIALGEFVPGQRLPAERELAVLLGVSRTTVREALGRLAASGYLEIRRGRSGGAVVREDWRPDSADVVSRTLVANWDRFEALLDFRALIEPLIARTAAERADPSDRAAIAAALQHYREAGSDREASRAADEALHLAVARGSHNGYLAAISRRVRSEISLGFSAEPYSSSIRARAIGEHAELTDAILAGDADAAALIAARHFTLTETALRNLVRRAQAAPAGRD